MRKTVGKRERGENRGEEDIVEKEIRYVEREKRVSIRNKERV